MPWGANIGAGDSDLTWQAMAGVGFKASSWADIALTYRYLKWELDGKAVDDFEFLGASVGRHFSFLIYNLISQRLWKIHSTESLLRYNH